MKNRKKDELGNINICCVNNFERKIEENQLVASGQGS